MELACRGRDGRDTYPGLNLLPDDARMAKIESRMGETTPCAGRASCGKDGPMRFEGYQSPRPRNRRVVGWRVFQTHAQKIAQRQRIRRAPGDAALGVNALEITDQQQPEIDPRRQSRPAHRLRIEAGALPFEPPSKCRLELPSPTMARSVCPPNQITCDRILSR
jgi:hypothetical protein